MLVKVVGSLFTCFEVADYFIWLANETGSFISNLKLQKLVYYAQAWYLAIYEKPLFNEDFEAWIHGPVIPDLYSKYKNFGWRPIQEDVEPDLPDDIESFLEEVADEYFACDAYELEKMTHLEDPWIEARKGLPMDKPSSNVIRKPWMKEYYGSKLEEEED
ncbi:SocA family protein [filamentous cyanobacterium LEGE 07170]|nr:SocA family protein [filamentous cyanobacterium LEGE 07170]